MKKCVWRWKHNRIEGWRFKHKKSYKGLSLLDFVVYPHYEEIDNVMYTKILDKNVNNRIVFIKNDGYMYIEQENVLLHGCCLEGSYTK